VDWKVTIISTAKGIALAPVVEVRVGKYKAVSLELSALP
jgi:hypothetical protein